MLPLLLLLLLLSLKGFIVKTNKKWFQKMLCQKFCNIQSELFTLESKIISANINFCVLLKMCWKWYLLLFLWKVSICLMDRRPPPLLPFFFDSRWQGCHLAFLNCFPKIKWFGYWGYFLSVEENSTFSCCFWKICAKLTLFNEILKFVIVVKENFLCNLAFIWHLFICENLDFFETAHGRIWPFHFFDLATMNKS